MSEDNSVHPLIQAVIGKSGDVSKAAGGDSFSDFVTIFGYIDETARPGYARVYNRMDFSLYTDVANSDVIYKGPLNPNNANSPWVVYVTTTTPLYTVNTRFNDLAVSYLGGAIAENHMKDASSDAVAAVAGDTVSMCTIICCPPPTTGG